MKEKYVEEVYPRYFIFGTHSDGKVDVASSHNDTIVTVVTVSRQQARTLIEDRDKAIDRLVELADAFDKAAPLKFKKFWYGYKETL